MRILLTNDDGIFADGIFALYQQVKSLGEVTVVAPAVEQSAAGHAITLYHPLRVKKVTRERGFKGYALNGTPADCVKFAVSSLSHFSPDLVISGINQGANTGVSVYYSGTISAAREGFINRIPAVAVSLASPHFLDFRAAVSITRRIVRAYAKGVFPSSVMLNVNVPPLPAKKIKGIKITRQAPSRFIEEFLPQKQKGGKKVYSLVGEIELYSPDGTSDEEAVAEGFISITPLKLDLTDYDIMPRFAKWARNGGAR